MEDRLDRYLQHLLRAMDSKIETVPGERDFPNPPTPIKKMGEVLPIL
jgi:hypothetical protein